jgi:hypothetical protein
VSGKPGRIYFVSSHGGGVYSVKGHALNRARYLLSSGYADDVQVFESQPLEWTEVGE